MALIDKISNVLGFGGKTQKPVAGADKLSTLHYTTSINNTPKGSRPASSLDLDGKTPPKYVGPLNK